MAQISLADGTPLSDFGKPYIVAEINTSHFGSVDTAKSMIDKAKEVGCDCVKFQSWSPQSLYSRNHYDENPIAKRIVTKFAFSKETLAELAAYSREQGVAFASTPYARDEVDSLIDDCGVPYIKVASMDLVNYPYLDYIGNKNVPIVLSTGMSDLGEIRQAVATIEKTGNKNICILHCVSIYPPDTNNLALNNIQGLREAFPSYPIGYSDHSLGIEMATAAVALGACLIEKHFTLDKSKIGMDNQMATEPEEMARMVEQCHNVHHALGSTQRSINEDEIKQRDVMRRSLVVTQDLAKGTTLTVDYLDAKRPGTEIPPGKIDEIIGKTLVRDVEADTLLRWEDFE